jgi:hypothetical protein
LNTKNSQADKAWIGLGRRAFDVDLTQGTLYLKNPILDSIVVRLRGVDPNKILNNVGSAYASNFFRMNDSGKPFNTSTTVLSGTGEWNAFYESYLVLGWGMDITVSNLESFPVDFVFTPTLASLGTNNSLIERYASDRYGTWKQMSSVGGQDRINIQVEYNLASLFGATGQYMGYQYYAGTGVSPAVLLYGNYGIDAQSNLLNGVNYTAHIWMDVHYRQRDPEYS